MTRFMLLQNYEGGAGCDVPMDQWPPQDVTAHITFQVTLNEELTASGELVGNHRLDAVRAHLQEMAGDLPAAADGYARGAARTTNGPERDYLTLQAARVRAGRLDAVPPTRARPGRETLIAP
jgi:hypothetical protein